MKGVRFAQYRDAGAPATICRAHSAQGADEILLLDIDASREGLAPDLELLKQVAAEIQVPLTFGGGLRHISRIHGAIESGADKICITTAALDRPALIEEAAHRFGAQAVMVGIDVVRSNGSAKLYDHRTRRTFDLPVLAWLKEAVDRGAGEIRLCAVDREGTRKGLDIDLYEEARAQVNVPIILEGGAGDLEQVAHAMKAGADSIGLGTLLVFSDNNLIKVRRFLAGASIRVRP